MSINPQVALAAAEGHLLALKATILNERPFIDHFSLKRLVAFLVSLKRRKNVDLARCDKLLAECLEFKRLVTA